MMETDSNKNPASVQGELLNILLQQPIGCCQQKRFKKVLVAHACNSSYLGDRDQEDWGLKTALANSSRDPILKKNHHKKKIAGGVAHSQCRPWVQAPEPPKKFQVPLNFRTFEKQCDFYKALGIIGLIGDYHDLSNWFDQGHYYGWAP
jgi:hypothetical protein